ncbi:surface-associated interspersed protein (SURFIN) [Plasmodium relictum]|uniref:Surface-associated interspersed protein (SURFIN) n=1 Tax=Plasmodium relictum TaxID=85471 RepID=A0A1J1GKK6_PLARL|nr:surface-associated interspersed protein (SURFIN) [Plasmodium relictum]CRG85559.1 surface-associated interspersed protein (SURFIN) [Plasmodium relictum]
MQEEIERIGRKGKKRFRRSHNSKEKWMNDFNKERDELLEELKKNDNDENCKKFLDFIDCRREYLIVSNEKLYEGGGYISSKIKNCVTSYFNTTEYKYIGKVMYAFGSEREIHNIKLKRGIINITEYNNWLNGMEMNFTNPQTWNVTDVKPFIDHWRILRNETEEYRNNIVFNHNCSLINDLNNYVITTHNPLFTTTNASYIVNNRTVSIANDITEPTTYTSVMSISLTNLTTQSKGISSTSIPYASTLNKSVQAQVASLHKNSTPTNSSYMSTKHNSLISGASPISSAPTSTPPSTSTGKTNTSTTIPLDSSTSGSVTTVSNSSITPTTGALFTSNGATNISAQSVNTTDAVDNSSMLATIDNLTTQTNMHNLSVSVTPTTVRNLSSSNTSFPSTIKIIKGTLIFTDSQSNLNNTDTENNSSTLTASDSTTNTNNPSFQNTATSVNNLFTPSPSSVATLTTTSSFPITKNSSHRSKNNSNDSLISPVNFSNTASINSFLIQSGTTNQNTPRLNVSENQNTRQLNVSDTMNTTPIISIPNVPTIIPSRNIVHDKNPGNILITLGIPFGTILFGIYFFLFLYKCTPIGSWIGKRKSKKKKKIKKIGSKDASTSMYPKKKSVKKMKHLVPSYGMQLPSCEITFENEKNVEKKKKYKEVELEGVRNEFVVQAEEEKIEEKENEKEYIKDKEKKKLDVKLKELEYLNEEMIDHEDSNVEGKIPINREMYKKKIFIEIYMTVLDECQREEWELHKEDFLKICLEEWKNDNRLYDDIIVEKNKVENTDEESSSISIERQTFLWNKYMESNKELLEKWKREKWFENLKKEWEKEQEDYGQITDGLELMEIEKGKKNMVEKQKIIWKHWLIKQRKWFMECNKEKWFNELLEEYEMEKGKYMKELPKENNEIMKNKKKKLIKKLWIEIHMMILEECKKEEWERNKEEFIKTSMNELKIKRNLDVRSNILEYIDETSDNVLERKDDIEQLKKEEWFTQLKLKWKNNEDKYRKEINEEILIKENEGIIRNPMLERQKIAWRKHWRNIQDKWRENSSNEEWFTQLDDIYKNKGKEYKKDIYERSVEEKKEEIIRKNGEKKKKYKMSEMENIDKKFNSITMKKKLKWKTILEIQMMVLEECKKEEWELNKEDFFQICIEEWTKKSSCEDILNKEKTLNGEERYDQIMLEEQTLLWKEWSERNAKMLEKWTKEEWFNKLKKEWKNYEEIYLEEIKEKKVEVLEDRVKNPMLERQKKIWRGWLKRHLGITEQWIKENWFMDVLNDYQKEEDKELQVKEIENLSEKIEKGERIINNLKEMDETKKKKLICKLCIEIYMAIIEECKKEELEFMSNEYLKLYIEEKEKKEEIHKKEIKKNERVDVNKKKKWNIMIEMKKKEKNEKVDVDKKIKWNILMEMKKREWDTWKKEDWFLEWKENWKKEEVKHMEEIRRSEIKNNMKREVGIPELEQNILWDRQWLEKQRNILKKKSKQNSSKGSMSQKHKKKKRQKIFQAI